MNLEDLIDENGLHQDEWSLNKPRFGKDEQLEVIGWSGKSSSNNKLYVLKCSKCSQDQELFGEGYFKALKGHLTLGKLPCGCSLAPRWTRHQYTILCRRKAERINKTFLGFTGDWKGAFTKLVLSCQEHGEWDTFPINTLLNSNQSCPKCGDIVAMNKTRKSDSVMIQRFLDSGAFHPETKFWRVDRRDSAGKLQYWGVLCPICNEYGEATASGLKQGKVPCGCSKHRQKYAYINYLLDDNPLPVAIKFGISGKAFARIREQMICSVYDVVQHSLYLFPDANSCKKAERDCKKEFECGVVLKRDFRDGYTETTWPHNLNKIIEIYERNGGIRQENP